MDSPWKARMRGRKLCRRSGPTQQSCQSIMAVILFPSTKIFGACRSQCHIAGLTSGRSSVGRRPSAIATSFCCSVMRSLGAEFGPNP